MQTDAKLQYASSVATELQCNTDLIWHAQLSVSFEQECMNFPAISPVLFFFRTSLIFTSIPGAILQAIKEEVTCTGTHAVKRSKGHRDHCSCLFQISD